MSSKLEQKFSLPGEWLVISAAVLWGTTAYKIILKSQPPEAAQAVVFCLGALLVLPFLFRYGVSTREPMSGWIAALYLGLVATAIAYILFGYGLKTIPVSTAVTLSLAEPLTASLLGIFLIGEQISLAAIGGAALVLAGLAVLSLPRRREPDAVR